VTRSVLAAVTLAGLSAWVFIAAITQAAALPGVAPW
jgi:hypothetical protein